MDTTNEPVAWRTHYPSGWEYKDGNPPFELKGNSQLLYTHPAELTDKDLDKLIKDAEQAGYMEMYIVGLIDGFNRARAIQRKASEK